MRSVGALHARALLLGICSILPLAGCAVLRAANIPIERYDPQRSQRSFEVAAHRDPGRTIIYLAFSGGGTRAAALAYGVLEELRETEISVDGTPKSLLDEVDTISGVSGGSFPAAYYGLYGDRIFEEFEPRFLRKNIQLALVLRALRPWNLLPLMTPWLSRSDLASRYYHEKVFDGATFADLREARGPRIYINATDLSAGERFTFTRGIFDVICSDIDAFPVATAVAASSAVPVLLSPIMLKNYAGTCGYEPPKWVAEALRNRTGDPRRSRSAKYFLMLQDPELKPYIHLIDGGTSDNLGLRAAIDFVTAVGSAQGVLEIRRAEVPDHVAFIVVNAETNPPPSIDLTRAAPSFAAMMNSVAGGQIRRYNFETLQLADELLRRFGRELSRGDRRVTTHMIDVSFEELEDEEERRYFNSVPTNFNLSDEVVDQLREVGRRLLRDSPEFQQLLRELR